MRRHHLHRHLQASVNASTRCAACCGIVTWNPAPTSRCPQSWGSSHLKYSSIVPDCSSRHRSTPPPKPRIMQLIRIKLLATHVATTHAKLWRPRQRKVQHRQGNRHRPRHNLQKLPVPRMLRQRQCRLVQVLARASPPLPLLHRHHSSHVSLSQPHLRRCGRSQRRRRRHRQRANHSRWATD